MTDVTNERWNQHSTILTLKGELAKQIGIADAARLEALELRHMLDDAATATSELMATAKHWQDRAEAAEKREAVLRQAIERVLSGREVYKGDHTEVESYDTGTIEDILRAALEAKP